jgi:Uma2 family endonuclease
MSVSAARKMQWSPAQYLAMENHSSNKHEYCNGEVFAMAGASPLHNIVASRTLRALPDLPGCEIFNGDQRIHVPPTGIYTYADGGIACGKWRFHADDAMSLLNPVLLFEVLSLTTRDYDLGAKRKHYEHIPSLKHLLLIDQPTQHVKHVYRRANGAWTSKDHTTGLIELPDLKASLAIADLYPS